MNGERTGKRRKTKAANLVPLKAKAAGVAALAAFSILVQGIKHEPMVEIIRELLNAKMNFRKLILWGLGIAAAVPIVLILWVIFFEIAEHTEKIWEVVN